ncbi:MAG: serine hydrolase [Asgard group archaeon]|nr:serine hydrolase [Asgard group archaeon]
MTDKKPLEKIEGMIATLMQQMKIPGLSLTVVDKGKAIYTRGIGARSLKGNLPATPNTLYGIGSVTKSFTCVALLQLEEQGKLKIDDPVSKHIDFKIGKEDKPVLIKHLMSHSSGIPDLGIAAILIRRHSFPEMELFIPLSSAEDWLMHANAAQGEIVDEPLKRFFYFNGGYALLGLIIEAVSGMKYTDYIDEYILKPLAMNRSTFLREEFEKEEDRMAAYATEKGKVKESTHPFDDLIYSAGGLLSSVKEMENYLQMFLNEGTFKGKQILKPESIKRMIEPMIALPEGVFGKAHYCFGLGKMENFFGETLITHGGSTAVSSAYLAFIPMKKMGVVIEGNVGNTQGGLIAQAILTSLLGKNPFEDHPALRLESKLNQLVGSYQTFKGINKAEIVKMGQQLYFKDPEQDCPAFPIIPYTDTKKNYKFWMPAGITKFPCEFIVNSKTGKISFIFERGVYHKIGPIKPKKKEKK